MNAEVAALRKSVEDVERLLSTSLSAQTKQQARNDIGIIFRDLSPLIGKTTDDLVLGDLSAAGSLDDDDAVYILEIVHRAQLLKSAIECLM